MEVRVLSLSYGSMVQLDALRSPKSQSPDRDRIGLLWRVGSIGTAPVSKTGIPRGYRGSSPLHVVWQRTQAGLRGLTANQVFVGSNPTVVLQIVARWERISSGFLI